jgi:hypothetical protein
VHKVLSARLDEAVVAELGRMVRRLGMTEKQFLEEAIRLRSRQADNAENQDVWADTLGAWKRREKPETTIRKARRAFEESFSQKR